MKNIILHLDDKLFYKMKHHKDILELDAEEKITWEDYIEILFGFKKLKGGNNGTRKTNWKTN